MFVRFALTAELAFNSDIPAEARGAVEKTVEESNAVLFRKGVPKGVDEREVGRITSWSVEAQYIRIAIESGAYTRLPVQKTDHRGAGEVPAGVAEYFDQGVPDHDDWGDP